MYCRQPYEKFGTFKDVEEAKANTETVLDLEKVPFLSKSMLRKTTIDKIKINDDHSMIAYTLEIGGTEKLTGGFRDLKSGEYLRGPKLENVSQIDFVKGSRD